jgi:hypothetical protein
MAFPNKLQDSQRDPRHNGSTVSGPIVEPELPGGGRGDVLLRFPSLSMTLARGVKAHSHSGSVSFAALPTIRPGRRSAKVWGVYPVRRILADYIDTLTEKNDWSGI